MFVGVFVIVTALAPAAYADRVSYHATATGDLAFTDNAFSGTSGNRDGDLFIQVRPGARVTYGMPRMIHDVGLEFEATQYAVHGNQPSFGGRAGWQAAFFPTPRTEITVAANAGRGVLNAISARSAPDQAVLEVQPLGRVNFQSADANEYGSFILSRELRLTQRLFARISGTDDDLADPTRILSAETGLSLGLERAFRMSSFRIEAGVSVMRMERVAPLDAPMRSRLDRQYNPRLRGAWRRDIDRRMSGTIDAGLVYVIPFGKDPYNPVEPARSKGLFPIVGGQLALVDGWGVATMALRRDVAPNLFVAQNTINDTALITAAMPIPWRDDGRRRAPRLVGLGAVGVMRTQMIDPITANLQSSFGVARLDLGVQYAPRPSISYILRYELTIQTANRDAMGEPVPGFFRNTIFFAFRVRYPEELAAQVPKRRQDSVRSDRKDLSPIGAEPVIPDLEGSDGDLQ